MSGWQISTEKEDLTAQQIIRLYNSVGFDVRNNFLNNPHLVDILYGPGSFGFFIFEDDELIASARVLSDDAMTSYVAELIVHPLYQDRGVGTALLASLKQRFAHTSIYLNAFLGQHGFFERNGIKPRDILVSCSCAPQATDALRVAS